MALSAGAEGETIAPTKGFPSLNEVKDWQAWVWNSISSGMELDKPGHETQKSRFHFCGL